MIELRKLNFGKLISVGTDPTAYSFDKYRRNGYEHRPINRYCVSCEEKGCNISTDDDSYRLTNISHGAHSSDFFLALKEERDTTKWHQEPIMFVYESPSKDYDIYDDEVPFNGYNKHPSKKWYWIHRDWESESYPKGFKRGEYDGFVWSAALTFELANVYMTNLVKCGFNNDERDFLGISSFDKNEINKTVKNCFENFLTQVYHPKP